MNTMASMEHQDNNSLLENTVFIVVLISPLSNSLAGLAGFMVAAWTSSCPLETVIGFVGITILPAFLLGMLLWVGLLFRGELLVHFAVFSLLSRVAIFLCSWWILSQFANL